MHGFSDAQPDGSFPGPEAEGNRAAAGVVAPLLVANQFVDSSAFLCAGAQARERVVDFRVPLPTELDAAVGQELAAMQCRMGGNYGFNLGYLVNDALIRPRNAGRGQYVLVADAPSNMQLNRVSNNHSGPRAERAVRGWPCAVRSTDSQPAIGRRSLSQPRRLGVGRTRSRGCGDRGQRRPSAADPSDQQFRQVGR